MRPAHDARQEGRVERRERELQHLLAALDHPVPSRMGHEGRQQDDPEPLGHDVPEQPVERRDEHEEHGELADLDAEIERDERRDEVVAGELKLLAQEEREPESVHDAEREGDHPSHLHGPADDVLERHVDDRGGDQRLDEGREPQGIRHEPVGRRDQRDRMREREGGDDDGERPQAPERRDEADEEQQVVDAAEDVPEPDTAGSPKAAWCHLGSSCTRPGSPWNSKARTPPSGGRNRSAVETLSPNRSTRGWIEKAERSDRIGYSTSTSSICWFQ